MARSAVRWFLILLYFGAGVVHLARPAPFIGITPHWVPFPAAVIAATGLAEIAGAFALAQPISAGLRKLGGICLAVYALCVWPANINHMIIDLASPGGGLGPAYHVSRMFAQPLLIWAALWASGAVDWPWGDAARARATQEH